LGFPLVAEKEKRPALGVLREQEGQVPEGEGVGDEVRRDWESFWRLLSRLSSLLMMRSVCLYL
jgi:hypothetical protein